MTATPAQVANDLDAQAAFFDRRESDLAAACRDCARAIRAMLNDGKIDGRTYTRVHTRMMNMEHAIAVAPTRRSPSRSCAGCTPCSCCMGSW